MIKMEGKKEKQLKKESIREEKIFPKQTWKVNGAAEKAKRGEVIEK